MRALMGLIKDRHGTYYAQQRVPERLQEAVARVLKLDKSRLVFLKRSLGTKATKEANTRAKPVQMEFDRVLQSAEALLSAKPVRKSLSAIEIKRMTEFYYASVLQGDDLDRQRGLVPLSDEDRASLNRFEIDAHSSDEFDVGEILDLAQDAFARADVGHVRAEAAELLETFGINLDEACDDYRKLSLAVLQEQVRVYQDLQRRSRGEPVATPTVSVIGVAALSHGQGGTLRDALEGWKKERQRPEGTEYEYGRAVEMFIQLHGNLTISDLRRSHARVFREALQSVPKIRRGKLLKASLPELSEYGRQNPTAAKVSPGTVNKQLGAVQAVAGWGHHNGLVPDDVPWADPFSEMRLEEEQSDRAPFDARDLQTIFDAPLFTDGRVPEGGKGNAAIWLPLLALFAGARQAEYAGLRVSDVRADEETNVPLMWIMRDTKAGRRLKTKTSERVVPVHPHLITLGFLKYVEARRKEGEKAWLFPTVAPDQKGALRAWSKWWGRYLRNHVGINDRNKVYHSFRHGFQDALRRTTPDEELRDALTGRSSGKSVGRTYGAKGMLQRWGAKALKRAVDDILYSGLDLSHVKTTGIVERTRGTIKPKKDWTK
jgi:integrase